MFYIDSHNLTELTGVQDALTDTNLTDDDVTSITAQLLDSDSTAVGEPIDAVYQEAGKWYVSWKRIMTEDATYTLEVTIITPTAELVIHQTDTAGYRGPRVD
jgi:hypothetical protein